MSNLQLVGSKNFGNLALNFYSNKQRDEVWLTRKQIGEALGYSNPKDAIYRIHKRHKTRLDKYSAIDRLSSTDGKQYKTYLYNRKGIMEICRWSQKEKANKFIDWVWDVIDEIMNTGSYNLNVDSIEDLIIAQAKSMKKMRQQIAATTEKVTTVEHRVDSLDAVNLEGDLRQRLNKMIRKYAHDTGLGYGAAWNEFKRRFNTAYSTNIELMKTNHYKQTGKELSTPRLLEEKESLEDAIRVADKMLNK